MERIESVKEKKVAEVAPQIMQKLGQSENAQLPPLLNRSSVTVSKPVIDLEKLKGELELESNEMKDRTAKNTLSSVLSVVIANALETIEKTKENMDALNEASELNEQLRKLEVAQKTLQGAIDVLAMETEALTKQIEQMKADMAEKKEQLKKAKTEEEKHEIQKEIDGLNIQISQKQIELSAKNALLSQKKLELSRVNYQISQTKDGISAAFSKMTDIDFIRRMNDLLYIKKKDVDDGQSLKAERSMEEEKWFEENSPIEVIMNSIEEKKQEMI